MNKYLKFTASILLLTIIGIVLTVIVYAQNKPAPQKRPQQDKQYTVSMTIQEWELNLRAINNPDDVTANERKHLANKIVPQLNKQLADTSAKNK